MSTTPTSKVAAAGIAGAASIVLVWLLGLTGVEVPPEVAAAFTALLSFATGWIKAPSPMSEAGQASPLMLLVYVLVIVILVVLVLRIV